MDVLIAGAGVGGLMCALECWRRGCKVRVLERSTHNQTSGDSFTIGPSALKSFKNWPDMAQRNEEIAYRPLISRHAITGERLTEPMRFEDLVPQQAGKPGMREAFLRHSRPKFHAMLLEQLGKIGIEVEYGCEVVEYSEKTEKAAVTLRDGGFHEADLVVAADGIRGKSWQLVTGKPVPARSVGDGLFRVAYPVEYALADPVVAERFPLASDGNSIMEWWSGPDMHASFWRNEDEMTVTMGHPDYDTAEESWSHRVSPQTMLEYAATIPGWPEVGNRVIRTIPPDSLVDYRLMWRDPQPTWTSPGGRVLQLGDAGHTFLPSSGNGGTQAMEDAISLAACLSIIAGDRSRIPEATRVHNLLRFERVSCLQAFGVLNRQKQHTETKNAKDAADNAIFLPRWVTEHDPEQYALAKYEEARAHVEAGTAFTNTNTPPGVVYLPWTIDGLLEAHRKGEPTVLDGDWS